jgi:hypothetical protein
MAIDSVPPSFSLVCCIGMHQDQKTLTGKRSRHKYGGKSANSANEWRVSYVPVFAANVLVLNITARIHSNSENNKDLLVSCF